MSNYCKSIATASSKENTLSICSKQLTEPLVLVFLACIKPVQLDNLVAPDIWRYVFMKDKMRCFGGKPGKEFYAEYHDNEWAVPKHDDQELFEMIVLEGAQAGLSWETVLKKRDGYRKAFYNFNIKKVAAMSDEELEALRENPEIIRNRLKIYSARKNAIVALAIQKEFGSLDRYLWSYVDGEPIVNHPKSFIEVPVTTSTSDALSKDLKKRGMTFVGSTIMYAYMQSTGMVNDHLTTCWRYGK